MTSLNNQQKQLLFDHCIGLTSDKETAEAEQLIASSKTAAEIHSKLKASLAPLESLEPESCPDELAEGTIWRLNNVARSSQLRLQQLLAAEQTAGAAAKGRLWRNLGQIAAVAAVILIAAGIWFAPLSFARQMYRQRCCQAQLGRVYAGLSNYISDHDGRMPAVATTAGAPWWKVGYRGKENHSNTRNMWLLVKRKYVHQADFVCPGRKQGRVIQRAIRLDTSQVKTRSDFPTRNHITYSLRIMCTTSAKPYPGGQKVLISDLSPLFESLPRDYAKPFKLELTKSLLTLNSINHNRRGQNVLFCDGRVKFIKKRCTDISNDDIFTLQNTTTYKGVEVPSCETDPFLAP